MKVLNLEAAERLYEENKTGKIFVADDFFISREARLFFEAKGVDVGVTHNKDGEKSPKPCKMRREKPEYMTSLNAEEMVIKKHPKIKLRGKLDSFQADLLKLEVIAKKNGEVALLANLEELLNYSRQLFAAEVLDKPFGEIRLFGLNEEELRYVSQHPGEYFGFGHMAPVFEMGEIAIELNALRAKSREVELAAVDAFCNPPKIERLDIIMGFNRMSSAIYIIYCRYLQENGLCGDLKG